MTLAVFMARHVPAKEPELQNYSALLQKRTVNSLEKKWLWVKTLYPCSSHLNSWDLWMFIHPVIWYHRCHAPWPYANDLRQHCQVVLTHGHYEPSSAPGTAAGTSRISRIRRLKAPSAGHSMSACVLGTSWYLKKTEVRIIRDSQERRVCKLKAVRI